MMPWIGLKCVIGVFPDNPHNLFTRDCINCYRFFSDVLGFVGYLGIVFSCFCIMQCLCLIFIPQMLVALLFCTLSVYVYVYICSCSLSSYLM